MSDRARELCARVCVIILFTLLSVNLLRDFLSTGRVTGLLFLASEALVVVLTVVRRRARLVDRSFAAALTTTLSVALPPMQRASDGAGLLPDELTVMVSAIGLALVIVGKMTLGRSFGVAPANRGVVVRGPYGFVRHPIYTGYLIIHIAFLVANPSSWNIAMIVIADVALVFRALLEERVLGGDERYRTYCARVGWHLLPGIF